MEHLLEWEDFLNEDNKSKYTKLFQDYKSSAIGSKEKLKYAAEIIKIGKKYYEDNIDKKDFYHDTGFPSVTKIPTDDLLKKGLEIIKDEIGDLDDTELTDKIKWMRKIDVDSLIKKYNIPSNMKKYTFNNLPSDIKDKMSK